MPFVKCSYNLFFNEYNKSNAFFGVVSSISIFSNISIIFFKFLFSLNPKFKVFSNIGSSISCACPELIDFFSYENVEKNESLVSLYAKNEYQKTKNEFIKHDKNVIIQKRSEHEKDREKFTRCNEQFPIAEKKEELGRIVNKIEDEIKKNQGKSCKWSLRTERCCTWYVSLRSRLFQWGLN